MSRRLLAASRMHLSKKAEKHVRKHYREFGFSERSAFTREAILQTAKDVLVHADEVFDDLQSGNSALIFVRNEAVLVLSERKHSIRTLFVLDSRAFIERRIARGKWKRIEMEE